MANAEQIVVKVRLTTGLSKLAIETLLDMTGVDKVEQVSPQRLRVTYDVTKTGWATLRERLQSTGAYTQTGMFMRWRDAWREFLEQNMRDNLRHRPACCSKPPPGGGLRSRPPHDTR